jgi:hypothetical protein
LDGKRKRPQLQQQMLRKIIAFSYQMIKLLRKYLLFYTAFRFLLYLLLEGETGMPPSRLR